jgi:hypothetical protein
MYKQANASLNNVEVTAELNASVDHAQLYPEYRRLVDEQAAVRRVGTLVARGAEPREVFDGRVWGFAAVGSAQPRPMPADTEVRIGRLAELVASVVVAGYRDEQKRQLLGGASHRRFLIDSLLEGRPADRWSLWEVASCLRLPHRGPFVVMVAEVPAVGRQALPEIESKLRGLDVYSAWRLRPDLQVGIVHVKSERCLDEIVGLVSRLATNRVGASARFDDLRDTPQALHFAKVMLRGRGHKSPRLPCSTAHFWPPRRSLLPM